MAINTINFAIPKPELNDIADVEVLNTGLDIIDNQMKVNADNINLKADQASLDATNATVALKADQATTYDKTYIDNNIYSKTSWNNLTPQLSGWIDIQTVQYKIENGQFKMRGIVLSPIGTTSGTGVFVFQKPNNFKSGDDIEIPIFIDSVMFSITVRADANNLYIDVSARDTVGVTRSWPFYFNTVVINVPID